MTMNNMLAASIIYVCQRWGVCEITRSIHTFMSASVKHMIECMICGVRGTCVYWMHDVYTSFGRRYFDVGITVADETWVNPMCL